MRFEHLLPDLIGPFPDSLSQFGIRHPLTRGDEAHHLLGVEPFLVNGRYFFDGDHL
jgi:hypothetical protein